MIKAGKLDRYIDILTLPLPAEGTYTAVNPKSVNAVNSWVNLFSGVPAQVVDIGGAENDENKRLKSERTAVFTTRFSSLIKETHFIRYDLAIWRIERLEELGRREGLNITAVKIST